jgi:endonuclease-3
MLDDSRLNLITQKLLEFGKTIENERLFPTVVPEAEPLIQNDPYAFILAVCLDRGAKAEVIWTVPYDIKNDLGHLDPQLIHQMSLEELGKLINRLPRKPRYTNAAPRTIKEITRIVVEECDGDAANLWRDKRAADVDRTLQSIYGVGEGIANMGVLLIEKGFGVRFSDRTRMDIKSDVHTMRVAYRLGVSEEITEEAAMAATRKMHPAFPGELDAPLWEIGRRWCFALKPNCTDCPMNKDCARRFDRPARKD